MINLMELARRNRLGKLFNPLQDQFNQNAEQPDFDMNGQMPQLNHEMGNRFDEMLNQFPVRENPSKLRKFGAVIAGMGSDNPMETSDRFANHHYYNALKDYTTKLPFFQRASENERAFNKQIMDQWVSDRKLNETERQNKERIRVQDETQSRLELRDKQTNETNQRKLEVANKRASTYADVARGGQLVMDRSGKTWIVYKDGQKREVDIDQFSPAELEELRQEGRESLEDKRSQNTIKEIDARGENTLEAIDKRIGGQKEVITHRTLSGVNSGLTGEKPISETQKKQQYTNNARKVISLRPEWKDYIVFDKNNNFDRINPRGSGSMKQLTPAEVKNLGNMIFERQQIPEDDKKSDPLGIRIKR